MTTQDASIEEGAHYLTRAGVARLLGVSPNTVTRWAREGRLPCQVTLGGHHRFDQAVMERLREELSQEVQTDWVAGVARHELPRPRKS